MKLLFTNRSRRLKAWSCAAFVAWLLFPDCHAASDEWFDQGPVFTLLEENDLVVRTDRHYTQGIKLSYLHSDNHVPDWIEHLSGKIPALGYDVRANRIGTEIGQSIFTPGDISTLYPSSNDRPYAGWLYTGFILQRKGLTRVANIPVLESFQLDLGIIGPDSLADRAQTWVHEMRGFAKPQGWAAQLHDEPGVALKYQRAWLLSPQREGARCFDFIPHLGVSLGNVETAGRAGGTMRLGFNLPDNFGVQTISSLITTDGGVSAGRTRSRWGAYVFAGAEGWAVAYNGLLDGNIFSDSRHVDHQPFVVEAKAGFALVSKHFEAGFTHVYRSREFYGQTDDLGYGSVFMKINF